MKGSKIEAESASLIKMLEIQVVCDKDLVGDGRPGRVVVYIQERKRPNDEVYDYEASPWLCKVLDKMCPSNSEIMEGIFRMTEDDFRTLVEIADSVAWFDTEDYEVGRDMTPTEIEEYINLFKK